MRRHFSFDCEGEILAGTIDEAASRVGLLIVSGGNEIRAGAFGGQAQLAAAIARQGFPVMRFDRRGIGDSAGENAGYRSSGPDIAAALAAFCSNAPQLSRIVALGNCDAATALAFNHGRGCAGLILANPWTYADNTPPETSLPPAAIRARYLGKLRNPREWARLLRGGVDLAKLARGVRDAAAAGNKSMSIADDIANGLSGFKGDICFLLAGRDRTAQAFAESWAKDDQRIITLADADHAFSSEEARAWLTSAILTALHEQARQFDMG